MNGLLGVYIFVLGAVLGSFLNVCIYRWLANQSVRKPRSRCPSCAQAIRWYDNIPILSWLVLRARCRDCGARISLQYPLVELACGVIWLLAFLRHGASISALSSAVFLTILLGIAITDARQKVIFDQFTLGGLVVGLALALLQGRTVLMLSAAGAALAYGFFWMVKWSAEKLLRKPALGVGDIHMMAMVGAFLGPGGALITMLLGSIFGLLIGVPVSWARGQLTLLGTYLPLGTFLAVGAAVTHTWGDALLAWYLRLFA